MLFIKTEDKISQTFVFANSKVILEINIPCYVPGTV